MDHRREPKYEHLHACCVSRLQPNNSPITTLFFVFVFVLNFHFSFVKTPPNTWPECKKNNKKRHHDTMTSFISAQQQKHTNNQQLLPVSVNPFFGLMSTKSSDISSFQPNQKRHQTQTLSTNQPTNQPPKTRKKKKILLKNFIFISTFSCSPSFTTKFQVKLIPLTPLNLATLSSSFPLLSHCLTHVKADRPKNSRQPW